MLWILGIIVCLLLGVVIWFKLPYSPIQSELTTLLRHQLSQMTLQKGIFTIEDIAELPLPLQKYFKYCGYMGTPKMSNMKAYFHQADFVQASKKLKINYTIHISVDPPARIAFIDSSILGIPFQGIDKYLNGEGAMKGVIAKKFTLFNEQGGNMNQSGLITCLAESILMPNFFLQDYMHWETLDETHVKATIRYYGQSASGIFTFDHNGAILSFTTHDREYNDGQGNISKAKWSAILGTYKEVNGIKYPSSMKAIWHLDTEDLVYFDGGDLTVNYNISSS